MNNDHKILIDELVKLLEGGSAHAPFKDAIAKLPANLRGIKPANMPYSIWQLTEHIRITQWDMLRFCVDADHQSPNWPDEYWPNEAEPANDDDWDKSVKQIENDLNEFIDLFKHLTTKPNMKRSWSD
ncbi:MAG TPA: DinB family protein [Mucilaginibacter sp.]